MIEERVLALDVSTKTGWASMVSGPNGVLLEAYGVIPQIHMPEGKYPGSFVDWAYQVFGKVEELIDRFAPDIIIVEETVSGSKSVYSQKILEFTHFLLARYIKESSIKAVYFLTGEWRSIVGCKMTKEESKHNKAVKKYKEEKSTSVAYNESGKRIGKLTKKHINIRRANELFEGQLREPLKKKNEDEADAILLGMAYHIRRTKV